MGQVQATGTATLTLPPTPYHQTSHIHLPTIFPNQNTLPSSKSLRFSLLSLNWR